MKTKRIITRQSIEELAKVCPGVTVPSVAQATLYGRGDGTRSNPFTWEEYMSFLDSYDESSFPEGSGVIYYINQSGNREGTILIGTATVIGNRPDTGLGIVAIVVITHILKTMKLKMAYPATSLRPIQPPLAAAVVRPAEVQQVEAVIQ